MKLSHQKLLVIAGVIWIAIGFLLLKLGIGFTMANLESTVQNWSVFTVFHYLAGTAESTTALLIILAIVIGHIKGRLVLRKTAVKNCNRIVQLPNPCNLLRIYTPASYVLILSMMGLGMLISWLKLPYAVRGFIDIAVGAALIQGSLAYFRFKIE